AGSASRSRPDTGDAAQRRVDSLLVPRLRTIGPLRRFADAGIATLVEARANSDARFRDAIVEREGESSNGKPPSISMNNVPQFGQQSQELNGLVDGLLELFAKPTPLGLVPF